LGYVTDAATGVSSATAACSTGWGTRRDTCSTSAAATGDDREFP
jgi:hypothetical protein